MKMMHNTGIVLNIGRNTGILSKTIR